MRLSILSTAHVMTLVRFVSRQKSSHAHDSREKPLLIPLSGILSTFAIFNACALDFTAWLSRSSSSRVCLAWISALSLLCEWHSHPTQAPHRADLRARAFPQGYLAIQPASTLDAVMPAPPQRTAPRLTTPVVLTLPPPDASSSTPPQPRRRRHRHLPHP